MRKFLQGVIVAAALSCAMPATAGFVHQDYKVAGDKKTTLDQDTGLEWLKLSETNSMSINQVFGQLGVDGMFNGWRLPTGEEVEALLSSIIPLPFNNNTPDASTLITSAPPGYVNAWIGWMGGMSSWPYFYSYGLYLQNTPTGEKVLVSGVFKSETKSGTVYKVYDDSVGNYTPSFSHVSYGVFLVRDTTTSPPEDISDVPAPFSMIIFGFGVMLLAGLKNVAGGLNKPIKKRQLGAFRLL